MLIVWILLGLLFGLTVSAFWPMNMLLGETRWLAMAAGTVIGLLFGLIQRQGERIQTLERQLKALASDQPAGQAQTAEPQADPVPMTSTSTEPAPVTNQGAEAAVATSAPVNSSAPPRTDQAPPRARKKTASSSGLGAWLRRWFTAGNVPVKVGVLVLMIGMAALLRYATEQGWLSFPIELRLSAVVLAALFMLHLGWRQRQRRRIFGLTLQGGAIGILLLTVFAAFRLYGLLPVTASFALMIALVAGAGILAVRQQALSLAIMALLAGFAAPLLLAGDQGQPILLFSWYAVLNLGIFGVAWFRAWPILNRIGFIFTFIIGSLWGVLAWSPAHYPVAQGFLLLFFLFYFLIPILLAKRSGGIEVLLVFGLPLLAIPLQIALLETDRILIAMSVMVGALLYLISAAMMSRTDSLKSLAQAHAVLAIGLATLAVPFAFSGPSITLIWALEGAALVWFGCLHQRRLSRVVGLALQSLAGMVWLVNQALSWGDTGPLVFNTLFIGAMGLALAGLVSAWAYQRAGAAAWRFNLIAGWALGFWLLGGWFEIARQLDGSDSAAALIGFFAITALLWSWLRARRGWMLAAPVPAASLLLSAVLVAAQLDTGSPLAGWGSLAWLLVLFAGLIADRLLAPLDSRWRTLTSLGFHLAVLVMLSAACAEYVLSQAQLGSGWAWMAGSTPVMLLTIWLLSGRRAPLSLPPASESLSSAISGLCLLALVLGLLASLQSGGMASPLPWLPLINPLELAQLIALIMIWVQSRQSRDPSIPKGLPAALGLLVLSVMTLRANHHLANIAWDPAILLAAHQVQASLSVLWSLLGVTAWIIGSRRRMPALWWAGAILMGIVLLKLLLIDRQFLSTGAGIGSFLAFGLLSILVGYLAPAPPKSRPSGDPAS